MSVPITVRHFSTTYHYCTINAAQILLHVSLSWIPLAWQHTGPAGSYLKCIARRLTASQLIRDGRQQSMFWRHDLFHSTLTQCYWRQGGNVTVWRRMKRGGGQDTGWGQCFDTLWQGRHLSITLRPLCVIWAVPAAEVDLLIYVIHDISSSSSPALHIQLP